MERIRWAVIGLALTSCAGAQTRSGELQPQQQTSTEERKPEAAQQQGTPTEASKAAQQAAMQKAIEAEGGTRAAAKALESAGDTERAQRLADYLKALDGTPARAVAQLVADLDHK